MAIIAISIGPVLADRQEDRHIDRQLDGYTDSYVHYVTTNDHVIHSPLGTVSLGIIC
jgi:rhamnose utilization protein RhaD (predicted bifunctional aldolase and dehydrogenase)